MELTEVIAADLAKIRAEKPLLHHITNMVVMNETANATLCLGALPVMAHAREEVEEMVAFAGALILNIGTLYPELIETMIVAGKKANELDIPIILDPVGVGATKLRTESAKNIISEVNVSVIRGNAAEIFILGGFEGKIKGVEALGDYSGMIEVAKEFAVETGCTIAITGKEDIVSDGHQVAKITNGDAMLSEVTGTGCMATTMIGGFLAVQKDTFIAAIDGLAVFSLAGEMAARISGPRPGTFHAALYDCLSLMKTRDIITGAQVEIK